MNGRTDEWKDKNYIPLRINAGGIIKHIKHVKLNEQ